MSTISIRIPRGITTKQAKALLLAGCKSKRPALCRYPIELDGRSRSVSAKISVNATELSYVLKCDRYDDYESNGELMSRIIAFEYLSKTDAERSQLKKDAQPQPQPQPQPQRIACEKIQAKRERLSESCSVRFRPSEFTVIGMAFNELSTTKSKNSMFASAIIHDAIHTVEKLGSKEDVQRMHDLLNGVIASPDSPTKISGASDFKLLKPESQLLLNYIVDNHKDIADAIGRGCSFEQIAKVIKNAGFKVEANEIPDLLQKVSSSNPK